MGKSSWLDILIYEPARKEILKWPTEIKKDFEFGILVFHSFKKKTQKTPNKEIESGKKRLKVFLQELKDES